jgi:DNA polymerase-4
VRRGPRRRSFGSQSAIGRGPHRPEKLDRIAVSLADRVTRRMRAKGATGRTVVLRLRFGDYTRATRSRTLPRPTAASGEVLAVLRALLHDERETIDERGITLLGIAVTNLARDDGQLELPLDAPSRVALDAAVDRVRDRFGTTAMQRGVLVRGGDRLAPWLVPGMDGVESE